MSSASVDSHSFPTRRSSDLEPADAVEHGHPLHPGPAPADALADRSEEHTSELQSLRHLVCRLLLEKKTWATTVLACCRRSRAPSAARTATSPKPRSPSSTVA